MYKGYIYRHWIINEEGIERSYIGLTTSDNVEKRWKNGKGYLHDGKGNPANTSFSRAINKYGWENFSHEVIGIVESDSKKQLALDLDEWEKYYIWKYDSFYNGYNDTNGGSKGRVVSEETKEKSRGNKNPMYGKGYLIEGEKNPFYGKKHDENTKEKMKKAWDERKESGYQSPMLGKKMNDEQKRKISEARKEQVFNMTEEEKKRKYGHMRGKTHSEETRQKTSNSVRQTIANMTEEERKQKYKGLTGKKHTEESLQKMSEAAKKRSTDEYRQKMSKVKGQWVKCVNTGQIFYSKNEAAKWVGNKKLSTYLNEYFNGKRDFAGKHPITGEKLYWEIVEKN